MQRCHYLLSFNQWNWSLFFFLLQWQCKYNQYCYPYNWCQYNWKLRAWLICNNWHPRVLKLRILHIPEEIRIDKIFLPVSPGQALLTTEMDYFPTLPGRKHKEWGSCFCVLASLWLTLVSSSFELQEFKNSKTTFKKWKNSLAWLTFSLAFFISKQSPHLLTCCWIYISNFI